VLSVWQRCHLVVRHRLCGSDRCQWGLCGVSGHGWRWRIASGTGGLEGVEGQPDYTGTVA